MRKTPTSQGQKSDSRSLSSAAISVLHKQIGKHQAHVFTFNGKAVNQVSTKAWYKALKRTGIEIFRWYDLRYLGKLAYSRRHPAACIASSWADDQHRKWCRSMRTCPGSISPNGRSQAYCFV
ncbi:hypothetical protein [Candidatus Nitrotoga arctica]|uniref:hypothetical protein n=1 Tax=Candidatus Nitrotoga arctica TaxID=453162 RepID=UPI001EFA9879|nr:hypothetical protein [Candidatus Nitrotoga arctica]